MKAKTFGHRSCIFLESESKDANFLVRNGVKKALNNSPGESQSRIRQTSSLFKAIQNLPLEVIVTDDL